ncbi:hypothetical protein M501DRAFT_986107 [Patellaria atrata CBS 101060]|uniref:LCCL domain-containing protein n=1 Tax=Patellaria atrata CBS 101060 TaxID=1346257 RepID=A0A9P4VLU7_9PEZI|nr:hypothetical protein M501DRAFT_986107 [Patellaria atrata CBS 101060]
MRLASAWVCPWVRLVKFLTVDYRKYQSHTRGIDYKLPSTTFVNTPVASQVSMQNNQGFHNYDGPDDEEAFLDGTTETSRLQIGGFDIDDLSSPKRTLQKWPVLIHLYSLCNSVLDWAKGPNPPKQFFILPWFPSIHQVPQNLIDRYFPTRKGKICLLLLFYLLWVATFSSTYIFWKHSPIIPDYGMTLKQLNCGTSLFYPRNECGVDGEDCKPFHGTFGFRCPPGCVHEINYQPMVVGGPIYRGDSFICAAALHASVITNSEGGCAVASRVGEHTGFLSSTQDNINSVEFNSSFPLSFKFREGSQRPCNGRNLQWDILAISLLFSVILSLFVASPSVFFFSTFITTFVHVGLVSDPPQDGVLPLANLFSILLGRLLPATFCAVVLYYICIKRSLMDLDAHIDTTVLWLGGCWFGALTNYTFEWIPISRLTSHDLEHQPGAKLALALIILVIIFIVFQQAYYFRLEGRLLQQLSLYGSIILVILVALVLPGLNLRIHHYILALILLPGTSMQTRPSLLYQGLLIGLFINGIARWGFDSVLQTTETLRGDGQFNSLLPNILAPTITVGNASNITFSWPSPEIQLGLDGVSVLVNDVERARKYFQDNTSDDNNHFTWTRVLLEPEYFRFAFLADGRTLDYTKAGMWHVDGSWQEMKPGPSK